MSDPLTVKFEIGPDWPTPHHVRRAADAIDQLSHGHFGDILRAYADAEDARFAQHGPYAKAAHIRNDELKRERQAALGGDDWAERQMTTDDDIEPTTKGKDHE